jgi:Protein of unknown function (DUF3071)
MQDIRLVGNDGEYLNLETQSGDKFRLVLDENLRAAVKRDSSVQLDSISISPREIQDAVRAGATAEEVATQHSVPLDYVEKFALTVIDEIGHIVASAQAVRISVTADRYSEATQLEFGEVVSERIASLNGKNTSWSAVKQEGAPWQVTVSYVIDGKTVQATWAFDQRKLVLSPENEVAIKFATGNHAAAPKARADEPNLTQVITLPTVAVEESAPPVAPVIAAVPSLAPVSAIEELTRASVSAHEVTPQGQEVEAPTPAAVEASDVPLSATADLLEALRKKRAAAAATPEPVAEPVESVEEATELVVEQVEPEQAPAPITPAKKGRPSMPSWDEIVFGTKTDD